MTDPAAPGTVMLMDRRYWNYAFYRSYLNLAADASRYYLGWAWWVLEPLALTAVFYVVFKFLRPRDEDFVYFLIVGVTTWLWFSNGVGNSTQSLTAARGLILQLKVPKAMFPLINVIAVTYKQAFVFAVLLIALALTVGASWSWSGLPILILVELLMIVAAANTVALLCVWLPDLRFVVTSGLQLMMLCSGIFFEISSFPERVQTWFRINPMAVLLEEYRLVLLHGSLPDLLWCAAMAAGSLVWIVLVGYAYRHWDEHLTRRIIA